MEGRLSQLYVLEVRKMMVCDEADVACSWSAVVAEEDLPKIDLTLPGKLIDIQIKDAPLTNLRPMTEQEVAEWRKTDED